MKSERLMEMRRLVTEGTPIFRGRAVYSPGGVGGAKPFPAPGYPFHTKSAERVWAKAQDLIAKTEKPILNDVLQQAMDSEQVAQHEISPEDQEILVLAIRTGIIEKPVLAGSPDEPSKTS